MAVGKLCVWSLGGGAWGWVAVDTSGGGGGGGILAVAVAAIAVMGLSSSIRTSLGGITLSCTTLS